MDVASELNNYGVPTLNYNRSTYHYKKRVKTTGNVGEIIPIYTNLLVQPGDTLKIGCTDFERLTTSKFPTMDNLYRSIFVFSCPWVALWDHANEFWGEKTDANFQNDTEYTVPKFVIDEDAVIGNRSILNRLGVPHMSAVSGRGDIPYSRLAYNMYLHVYNNYFRDQNYIPAISFSKGDEDITYSTFTGPKNLLKAARFHDYFSTIPEPTFGAQPTIPLGTNIPVFTKGVDNNYPYDGAIPDMRLKTTSGNNLAAQNVALFGRSSSTPTKYATVHANGTSYSTSGTIEGLYPSNLYADTAQATGPALNTLRQVIAESHIKERLAWYGRLYQNIVSSMWGVNTDLNSLRIPLLLHASRQVLNMDTVLQTSSTDATSPQGEPAGYSATVTPNGELFTKSFDIHSVLMILAVVRQDHTYSQGINCQYQKFRKYDYFWNEMQGLGAQDIKMSEIYVTGSSTDNDKWGCKPAWQEYRMEVDECTGQLAPSATGTLANYTYSDYYATAPVNGQNWIEETDAYVDRTLTTASSTADQLMFDFVFDITKVTEVDQYNLPGIERV